MDNNGFPQRKVNRLKDWNYSEKGTYFVTVCARNKQHIFGRIKHVGADNIRPEEMIELSEIGKIIDKAIKNIGDIYKSVYVEKYVIMPNHIHILYSIKSENNGRIISAPTRSVIIGQMKRYVSKQAGEPVWQKSFYDHVIRNQKSYEQIWQYIENDPLKWDEDCFYMASENDERVREGQ